MFFGGLNGDEFCDDWGPEGCWEPGEDRASYAPTYKTCKHCKKSGLHWIFTGVKQGWRLGESDGKIHTCFKDSRMTAKKPFSSKVYDLLSNAIQGNHLSEAESKEYDRLKKYFKDNGLTVDELTKEGNYPRFS